MDKVKAMETTAWDKVEDSVKTIVLYSEEVDAVWNALEGIRSAAMDRGEFEEGETLDGMMNFLQTSPDSPWYCPDKGGK